MAEHETVSWLGHTGVKRARVKDFDIIDCETCGFVHAAPLPAPESLITTYRDDYYVEEKPTFLKVANEDQAWGEMFQADRLEIFERVLAPDRRRVLDIGCGPGFFLKTAKDRGWTATGIEPSRQAATHARGLGLDIVEAFFGPETAPGLGRFDAVHLNNVLEHLPDPIGLLTLARDLIEPGGLICINVPNDYSPFQLAGKTRVGAGEWWLAPPHHLNYFNFDSAARLLQRLGFSVVERTTSFPMELFLMMGENYIGKDEIGRACHNRRKSFDLAFEAAGLGETRRAFYRALAQCGIGREAVLIATKP
jgi:SAM-dependent methyltransferase